MGDEARISLEMELSSEEKVIEGAHELGKEIREKCADDPEAEAVAFLLVHHLLCGDGIDLSPTKAIGVLNKVEHIRRMWSMKGVFTQSIKEARNELQKKMETGSTESEAENKGYR